jgi:hypothetical protein
MEYTFEGRLCGYICPDVEEPIANGTVRLYRVAEHAVERATARPKETFRVLEDDEVDDKADRLLAEAETDEDGSFVVELDEDQHDYDGEAFQLDVRVARVPGEYDADAEPVQFTVSTLQPRWRKREGGAYWFWEHCLTQQFWCLIRSHFRARVICGRVTFCETDEPINGVTVRAFDTGFIQDDPLGTDVTAGNGEYRIYYTETDYEVTPFSPWISFEQFHGPDAYFTIEASDGTVLLDEDRSEGRTSGRENVGNCAHIDLCVPGEPDGEEDTTALWTGVGSAFDVPTDFTNDGYARSGGTEYALTGSTPLRTPAGNPVEYRFRLATSTRSNADPALPESDFDRTVGIDTAGGNDEDLFVATKVGKAMVLDTTGTLQPIPVIARRSDLEPDGWLNVDEVIDRALTDAGYTRSDLRYWDDVDTLMTLNTQHLAPDDPNPSAVAGEAVDVGDEFPVRSFAFRFEARDAATGTTLGGHGQTLNAVVMDNNPTHMQFELIRPSGIDSCTPIPGGAVGVKYTAYHPHLEQVRFRRQKNEDSPTTLAHDAAATDKIPFDQDVSGGPDQVFSYDGPGDFDDVANHFDITPSETCTYIVWLTERRRLHTGNSQVDATNSRLIPFHYEA